MGDPLIQLATSLLCLICGSWFASLFSSFTQTQEAGLNRLETKYAERDQQLQHWIPRWDRLRSVLLILAVVFQLTSVVITALVLRELWPRSIALCLGLGFGFLLFYIFAFRIMPRVLAESSSDRITIAWLRPVGFLSTALLFASGPVAWVEQKLMNHFMEETDKTDRPSTEDEILSLVDQIDERLLETQERDIIKSVFEFDDTLAREIMTPRVSIQGIEDDTTIAEAIEAFSESSFSRFPVFNETIDNVRGILHIKDVLRMVAANKLDCPVGEATISTTFAPENMPINDLLRVLQKDQHQSAIVVDEYGGTAGLITIEDILEELVGEIEDEYDEQTSKIHTLADGSSLVDASASVNEVNEAMGLKIPEREEYDSVGGYVFFTLGCIPVPGDSLSGDDHHITIKKANERQLIELQIRKEARAVEA